jgi:hypothetical protein
MDTSGERHIKHVVAYSSSHEKCAGDRPDDSSSNREYRVRKKTWKTRSSDKGPK